MKFFGDFFKFAREKCEFFGEILMLSTVDFEFHLTVDDDGREKAISNPPTDLTRTKNPAEIEQLLSNEPENVKQNVLQEWKLLDDQVEYLLKAVSEDRTDQPHEKIRLPPDEFEIQTNKFITKLRQSEPETEPMVI